MSSVVSKNFNKSAVCKEFKFSKHNFVAEIELYEFIKNLPEISEDELDTINKVKSELETIYLSIDKYSYIFDRYKHSNYPLAYYAYYFDLSLRSLKDYYSSHKINKPSNFTNSSTNLIKSSIDNKIKETLRPSEGVKREIEMKKTYTLSDKHEQKIITSKNINSKRFNKKCIKYYEPNLFKKRQQENLKTYIVVPKITLTVIHLKNIEKIA